MSRTGSDSMPDGDEAWRRQRVDSVLAKMKAQRESESATVQDVPSEDGSETPRGSALERKRFSYSISELLLALKNERQITRKGYCFKVTSVERIETGLQVAVEPVRKAGRGTTLDENLEGATACWPNGEFLGRGDVYVVDADKSRMVLRFVCGEPPAVDQIINIYTVDFLTPLIERLDQESVRSKIKELFKRDLSLFVRATLTDEFSELREKQKEAVAFAGAPISLVEGPPGTGKTFTLGAAIAHQLISNPDAKILLLGPTNAAVDGILLSADRWLQKLGRHDLASQMKRVGSRFRAKQFTDAPHLLPRHVAEAAERVRILELEEPRKDNLDAYVRWRREMDAARKDLNADILAIAAQSVVIAMTTAAAVRAYSVLEYFDWSLTLFDESSQIVLPAAFALATLGRSALFAGDPKQLAAVVQSADKRTRALLERTAFESFRKRAHRIFLDEQSRMAPEICEAVSSTFYEGRLNVCKKASRDRTWIREREGLFIDGYQLPNLATVLGVEQRNWSKTYGGAIRYWSADAISTLVEELSGSYVDPSDILVLTPFRSQRALIRSMLRKNRALVDVTTVHRAQGSERRIVIFDPVDGVSPFLTGKPGQRLINVAASRAMAHLFVTVVREDLENLCLERLVGFAPRLPFHLDSSAFRFGGG